jgi:hypothetical protein
MFRRPVIQLGSLSALGFVVALAGWPAPGEACSCPAPDEGFILKTKTVVPQSLGGFPWWGDVLVEAGEDTRADLPPKNLFRLDLIRSGRSRRVPFDLEFAPNEFPDTAFGAWGRKLVILKPRELLSPGAKYRLSFRRRASSGMDGRPRITGKVQIIDVSVGTDSLMSEDGGGSVTLNTASVAPLEVRKGAVCSTVISAAQQPISFELPASAAKWRNALLFSTTVDGGVAWRPSHHNCVDVPHGTSWVGQGDELLFARCSGDTASGALAEGDHLVTMTAWLAGTVISFRAERKLSLRCDAHAAQQGVAPD